MQLLLFGFAVQPRPLAAVALGRLEYCAPLLLGVDCALHACHGVFLFSFGSKGQVRAADAQPFSSLLTRLLSLADTSVRPSRRRVRVLDLCSSRWRRSAFCAHDLAGSGAAEPLAKRRCGSSPWACVPQFCACGQCLGGSRFGLGGWRPRGPARRASVRRLGASLRAAVRCQHHRHVAAVLLGGRLDEAVVGDVGAQPLQQPVAQFGPRLLASAEHDRHLDLRPRFAGSGRRDPSWSRSRGGRSWGAASVP